MQSVMGLQKHSIDKDLKGKHIKLRPVSLRPLTLAQISPGSRGQAKEFQNSQTGVNKYKAKAFKATKNNGSKIRLTSGGAQLRNIMSIQQPSIDAVDAHKESVQEPLPEEAADQPTAAMHDPQI